MHYVIVALVSLLAGGVGGYLLGAKVERAAALAVGKAKQIGSGVGMAADQAVNDIKKAF